MGLVSSKGYADFQGFARKLLRSASCAALGAVALLLLLTMSARAGATEAGGSPAEGPKGDAEFRAGWAAFAEPAATGGRTPDARQEAKLAAIPHLEAAVEADERNTAYQASLAYVRLSAGKYEKAREAIDRAIDRERGDPLLYVLRGQAEAALAQMKPEEAGKRIGPALKAFERAAELDPKNALPLLQAVSVAFDADRIDLARSELEKALERPECRLYRLPVPEDLMADRGASLRAWQYVQLGQWLELISRCQNAQRLCMRLGAEAERAGDLEAAEKRYLEALEVGGYVGIAEPRLFITVNTAINMLEDAYKKLGEVGTARKSEEAERWRNEVGIMQLGRQQLFGALQAYQQQLSSSPPLSVAGILKLEAEHVTPVIAGIGLPLSGSAAARAAPPPPRPAKRAVAPPAAGEQKSEQPQERKA